MISNDPESRRLYDLKAEHKDLSQRLKYEENEKKRTELEHKLFEMEREIDNIYDAREGEAHIEWLLSEFGEDVFPDRD